MLNTKMSMKEELVLELTQVALKGRAHHHGDLSKTPYRVDRQSWNSHDANALIVYDANDRSLGFIEKDMAGILGPLLRAGFFLDIRLKPLDSSEHDETGRKRIDVTCTLQLELEPARASEFWALDVGKESRTLSEALVPKKSSNVPALAGFIRASQLKPAKNDEDIQQAFRKLKLALMTSGRGASSISKFKQPLESQLRKQPCASTLHDFFSIKKAAISQGSETGRVSSVAADALKGHDIKQYAKDDISLEISAAVTSAVREEPREASTIEKEYFRMQTSLQPCEDLTMILRLLPSSAGWKLLTDPKRSHADRADWVKENITHEDLAVQDEARDTLFGVLASLLNKSLLVEDFLISRLALAWHDELLQAYYRCIMPITTRSRTTPGEERPTMEQLALLETNLEPGSLVRVNAFAGAGKTSCLVHLTKRHPQKKFLYLCFNKSVQLEAVEVFPPNVECRTVHSLAFDVTGYKAHACVQSDDFDAVKRWLIVEESGVADEEVEVVDLDATVRELLTKLHIFQSTGQMFENVEPIILRLWQAMKDGKVPMTYAGVLKECALRKQRLDQFQVVLLDEAQDCNPCALEVFLSQTHAARVMVGDCHQAIYGFTNAKNALKLEGIPPELAANVKDFVLTTSFRFGPSLAMVATSLLRNCGRRTLGNVGAFHYIIGGNKINTVIGSTSESESPVEFCRRVQRCGGAQCCFIARTNATCLEAMVVALQSDPHIRVRMVDGLSAGRTDDLLEVALLMAGTDQKASSVKRAKLGAKASFSSFPSRYPSVDAFYAACISRGLVDWISVINAVRRWGPQRTIEIVETLRQNERVVSNASKAELLFSTVHRVKGLEFDGVFVADDFDLGDSFKADDTARWTSVDEETVNLLYVAFTRAKRCLAMNRTITAHPKAMFQLVGRIPLQQLGEASEAIGSCSRSPSSSSCGLCFEPIKWNEDPHNQTWKMTIPCSNLVLEDGICTACRSRLTEHFATQAE